MRKLTNEEIEQVSGGLLPGIPALPSLPTLPLLGKGLGGVGGDVVSVGGSSPLGGLLGMLSRSPDIG